MTAKDFQQSPYFDNILVSTIRFLDSLPAKTPNEKAQFMRGLSRVIPSFPKSVMEKKVLPALLEEMKDRDLFSLILQNVFRIIQLLPSGKRSFTEKILPRLREIFLTPATQKATASAPERDPAKEAGLMVLLENIRIITDNCSGKEFKDGKSLNPPVTSIRLFFLVVDSSLMAIRYPTHYPPRHRVSNSSYSGCCAQKPTCYPSHTRF
jgi:SCY1-like protein 2